MPIYRVTGTLSFRREERVERDGQDQDEVVEYEEQAADWEAEGRTPSAALKAATAEFAREHGHIKRVYDVEWADGPHVAERVVDATGGVTWKAV